MTKHYEHKDADDKTSKPEGDSESKYIRSLLETVRMRLLDQTRRNRMLNYKETARDIAIIDKLPDQVFDHLVENKGSFYFDAAPDQDDETNPLDLFKKRPASDSEFTTSLPRLPAGAKKADQHHRDNRLQTPFPEKELDRKLRRLYQEHRTRIEETGANDLYLMMGLLQWYDAEETEISYRSPLILLPVRIEKEKGLGIATYALSFNDEALDSNYSLLEKLRHDFDLSLPALTEDHTPEQYLSEIERAISSKTRNSWSVGREMVLGLFRFQKQIMWHDLDPSRWPSQHSLLNNKLIRRIMLGSKEGDRAPGQQTTIYSPDDTEKEKKQLDIVLIRDADTSQYSAIVDSIDCKAGEGLVIEGPPGTGKSQTITNLIAATIEKKKTVLFIAEKMAALEVVYKRLNELELGDFCLQLHGLKTNKIELLQALMKRIHLVVPQDHQIRRKQQELKQVKDELIELSNILSEPLGPEDLPLYKAIWRMEVLRQQIPAGFEPVTVSDYKAVDLTLLNQRSAFLNELAKEWSAIPSQARIAWHGFVPKKYSPSDGAGLEKIIGKAVGAGRDITGWLNAHNVKECAASLFEIPRLMKLGSLDAETAFPMLPSKGDADIILKIVDANLLAEYEDLLGLIRDYLTTVAVVNNVTDYQAGDAKEHVEELNKHCKRVASIYGADCVLSDLPRELRQAQEVAAMLSAITSLAEPVVRLTDRPGRVIADFNRIASEATELMTGPAELSLHATPAHIKQTAGIYLKKAHDDYLDLEKLKKKELQLFEGARAWDAAKLRGAYETLVDYKDSWTALLHKEYRNAKNAVRRLLRDKRAYSKKEDFLRQINKLVEYCERRDSFAENQENHKLLGTLFKGVETDWHALGRMIEFSKGLRGKIGAERAEKVLANWDDHEKEMMRAKDDIERSLRQIEHYKSRDLLPATLWQRPCVQIADGLDQLKDILKAAIDFLHQPWCNTAVNVRGALEACEAFHGAQKKERSLDDHPIQNKLIGHLWAKATTNIDELEAILKWLKDRLTISGVNLDMLRWASKEAGRLFRDLLMALIGEASKFRTAIENYVIALGRFGDILHEEWIGDSAVTIDDFTKKSNLCIINLSGLPLLARWHLQAEQVRKLELGRIIDGIRHDLIKDDQAGKAYQYSLYSQLLREKSETSTKLTKYGLTHIESLRENFARLDRAILKENAQHIRAKLGDNSVTEGIGYGPVKDYSEKRLIIHEANKKRKHLPIRQLIKRSHNAITALKPCFLMSPLSVAQYLEPGKIEFDFVIMDEASQIRPEDALGAIARGGKVLVVGDPKQLPPTRFFDAVVAEDEEAEETIVDDTESILDVCLKQFPFRRLNWHYRSQHESLIQFSNDSFYGGDLNVFPSSRPGSREYGVHYTFIKDPNYKNGRNRREAEVVVENIVHHLRKYNQASLGIAAFNRRQAEEIQLLFDKVIAEQPDVSRLLETQKISEPLFIKNLENVQGDERDVIFISTTYGPERAGGPVFQRFGPINSAVGWRRLNVIATRARQRVEVFSSMRPTDVRLDSESRLGVKALREYLEYAETGKIAARGARSNRSPDSEFEEAVANVLRSMGYETDCQVGVAGFYIDLGVHHPMRPGEYLMGIECDGAQYHSAQSVRDRDRLRQEILKDKGWFIHRIWSTSWYHARDAEIERLRNTLEERQRKEGAEVVAYYEKPIVKTVELTRDDEEEQEVQREHDATTLKESLSAALDRFWEQNIKPLYPSREMSILSDKMINLLVKGRPEVEADWFKSVPMELRQRMNPKEKAFLQDILEVIVEYS